MAEYRTGQIRNVAVLGHTGAGKSTLLEALLYQAHAIPLRGSVSQGTNHADFTAQEKAHQHSLEPSFLNIDYLHHHLNIIDTPGLPDFFGRALQVLSAVESVLLVINAASGIEGITQRAFTAARAQGKAVMIVINHIDGHESQLAALLDTVQHTFGPRCLPVNLPGVNGGVVACYPAVDCDNATLFSTPAAAYEALLETVVEEDEQLLERYLEQGESLTAAQLHPALEQALRMGHLVPVCFTSAEQPSGIQALLDLIIQLLPNPLEANPPQFVSCHNGNSQLVDLSLKSDAPLVAQVFRLSIDPFLGKRAIVRIYQGTLLPGAKLLSGDARKPVKIPQLYTLQGEQQLPMSQGVPGDIVALSKMEELDLGDVLHDSHEFDDLALVPQRLPQAIFGLAVSSQRQGDEQKITAVLQKLISEDPSLQLSRNETAGQTVLQGLGDQHLQIALEKAFQVYRVKMHTEPPAVAYRETISSSAQARYRHKKQSGGAGQFGEVLLSVTPLPRGAGFVFVNQVVGGAIPGVFIPAVEKGVREALNAGELAGYPLTDLQVTLLDGKHHSVDSKEIAFVCAGKKALMAAVAAAEPVLLEPWGKIQLQAGAHSIGDITAELASRRALIMGTQTLEQGEILIEAEVPMAMLGDFAQRLKALTGAQGHYTLMFSRYDVALSGQDIAR
ncbi:elongation factor G [Shewanella sp. NFH-SH190041]|uniref:elongation factor G n=1 Tax=Shewanella sp. NFH-SH190041 TaxID=2950245 RepID=UPI0021C47E0C|nr:elongation factor G [Shewanella sp. NFH-SH190041]BDM65339.1 elongation factor G [Shewanella sp. NFH-SH190041]